MSIKIAASILNSDFRNLEREIKTAEAAGIDWIHLDIMDGHFVPNISFGPHIVSICRKITNLPLDAHLMISNPDQFISAFSDAGADYISVHIENNPHIHRTLQAIKLKGKHPGIVVNPGTPLESIYSILNMVDYVLLMSVNPGFGGQAFLPETITKIKNLSRKLKELGLSIPIEIDGGINNITAKSVLKAGAEILVSGSYIFNNTNSIDFAVNALRTA